MDHKATVAGTTPSGHWYCICGRKVRSNGRDNPDGTPVVIHTSGLKNISGKGN